MPDLRYTLFSDGSSDESLIPILTWLLRECGVHRAIQSEWADLRRLPRPPKTMTERIRRCVELFPCDLLFVHRDAEREPHAKRVSEIKEAFIEVSKSCSIPPAICVVPVRMQEAWLLFDEKALRQAAGNPNGLVRLKLPPISHLESLPNPKGDLYDLIRRASELSGRRLKKLNLSALVRLVSDWIDDFSPLRMLTAFASLEVDIRDVVSKHNWTE